MLTTTREEPTMEFTVESLETPALTKAQLAELLFEQIGLNKREFAQAAGERIELSYSIGESTGRPTAAVVLSGELAEIDEAAARALIAAAADAPSFVVHLKLLAGPPEIVLVFRPVETRRAIEGLAKACAVAL